MFTVNSIGKNKIHDDSLIRVDPFDIFTRNTNILDKALNYAINEVNIGLIMYILEGAEERFLNASIQDEQILCLLEDINEESHQQIIRYLVKKDITLLNEEDKRGNNPNLNVLLDIPPSDDDSSNHESNWDNMNKSNRSLVDKSLLDISKSHEKNTKFKIRKKKNPFNKFLEKADIIEIAIRAPNISDSEEVLAITILYDHLSVPTNETVTLFKLLIYYEQLQTFEMLLKHHMNNKEEETEKLNERQETQAEFVLGRKDDDNVYDYDEIISDAFSYAITINKLHIAFYLFKTYEDDVYGNKMLCIKSILNSFKNDDTQINQVMYLEERLFILEKFMNFIEYKMALEFLNVIHQEISDDPKINFLVYCSNPLKIIVMLLNIVIHLSSKHQNLKFKAQKVRSTLCDISNGIIDTSTSMNEVKDMLLDKTYNGTEVIDLIEMLDIIEILQNPMMDSIVSNMYYGPYERESFLKKSTCAKVFDEQLAKTPGTDPLVTKSFKIFGSGHSYKSFKKYFKAQTKIFKK